MALLLPQHVEAHERDRSRCSSRNTTMSSPSLAAGQNPYTPRAVSSSLLDDAVEQRPGVVVELARRRPVLRVIEDRREAPLQLPRREEERPVDERAPAPPAARRSRTRRPVKAGAGSGSARQSIFSRLASAAAYGSERPLAAATRAARAVSCCSRGCPARTPDAVRRLKQARHDIDRPARRRARAPSTGRTPARSSPPCAAGSSSRRR